MTQTFADALTHFAESTGYLHMRPIIARLRRPIRVAVVGRDGVGRGTVAAALRRCGIAVLTAAAQSEVVVVVIAETVKPEDLQLLTSSPTPAVVVLTKADLTGAGPDGPMAESRRRAADVSVATGAPTVPVIGLLAALGPEALHDGLIAALTSFVTEPADLTSVDAFLEGVHAVGRDVRELLLRRLDRFGIAHGVLALANGCDAVNLTAHLQRLGNLDEVLAELEAAAVQVRYLRVCAATAELHCLAIRSADDRVAELSASDEVVLAVMGAAVDVVEAAGLVVDRGDTSAAHLGRAVQWRRYGLGPVDAVHRRCSEDIVRGSLRLLGERSA